MSLRKRLRIIFAVLFKGWHERTCPECRFVWMETGTDNGLLRSCAECETKEMEVYLQRMETKFNEYMRSEGVQ